MTEKLQTFFQHLLEEQNYTEGIIGYVSGHCTFEAPVCVAVKIFLDVPTVI